MRTVSGFIRTHDQKIWFWISWWDEEPFELPLSTDGGVTWKELSIRLAGKPNALSMLGVLDATTFIYGNGNGIHRSTDTGTTSTVGTVAKTTTRVRAKHAERAVTTSTAGISTATSTTGTYPAPATVVDTSATATAAPDTSTVATVATDTSTTYGEPEEHRGFNWGLLGLLGLLGLFGLGRSSTPRP